MKTIEEAAVEYAVKESNIDNSKPVEIKQQLYAHELMYAFQAGVEFAQRWIPVSEELPEDGEIVLIMIEDCHIDVVVGIFNGIDWFCRLSVPTGRPDFIITDKVTHWRPIEYK